MTLGLALLPLLSTNRIPLLNAVLALRCYQVNDIGTDVSSGGVDVSDTMAQGQSSCLIRQSDNIPQ
jgi:hypothetical protein